MTQQSWSQTTQLAPLSLYISYSDGQAKNMPSLQCDGFNQSSIQAPAMSAEGSNSFAKKF